MSASKHETAVIRFRFSNTFHLGNCLPILRVFIAHTYSFYEKRADPYWGLSITTGGGGGGGGGGEGGGGGMVLVNSRC